jgi:hypothetical protein
MADKRRIMINIHRDALKQKIETFIQENQLRSHIIIPKTYSTNNPQMQQHNNRQEHKHLTQTQPTTPKLNALSKTHKEDKLMRPAINNIQVPCYELAKHLNKKLNKLINVPENLQKWHNNKATFKLMTTQNNHIRHQRPTRQLTY